MPVIPAAISAAAVTQYFTLIPTAVNARRKNPDKLIPEHNPAATLITACTTVFCEEVMSTSLLCAYTGVAAPGSAIQVAPVAFSFTGASLGPAALIAAMGWTGSKSLNFSKALTSVPANLVSQAGVIICNPVIGGGPGTGIISGVTNPALAGLGGKFYNALKVKVKATGKFSVNDAGATLTPEISKLLLSLGTVYATIFSTIFSLPVFVGGTAPSPMTSITQGKIL